MTTCRLLAPLAAPGATQMSLDEALLETAEVPTLRFYSWQPAAVSLGCFQDHAAIAPALPAGMAVVRRITGGGAIWHQHEVTYSLVGTLGRDGLPQRTAELYPLVHRAVLAELERRGARLAVQPATVGDRRYRAEPRCFASPAADDLVAPGAGKALGSAARARGARVLLHGSLKTASNPWDGAVVASCGLDPEQARAALAAGICAALGWEPRPGELTAAEQDRAALLERVRYGSPDWVERRAGPRP
ncbi:MAG: hypothetical protein L6R48_14145 [Planctomycetes bacterium]|nr:hypothetical protein [Planctomycetota bacterium]